MIHRFLNCWDARKQCIAHTGEIPQTRNSLIRCVGGVLKTVPFVVAPLSNSERNSLDLIDDKSKPENGGALPHAPAS